MSFISQPITLQSLFGKNRVVVGGPDIEVVISENTTDALTITKQPVQTGASITDHAFKEPTVFTMVAHLRDSSLLRDLFGVVLGNGLKDIYDQLLKLQASRDPFDVLTPKRNYKSMLMQTLIQTTDKSTENILSVSMTFQEIIIVDVKTNNVPRAVLKNAGSNGATQPAGNKSTIKVLIDAFTGRG